METSAQPYVSDETLAGREIERGSFAPAGAVPVGRGTRLCLATFNIRYAVGSYMISGGILRRFRISRPARRPRLVEANIRRAARLFSDRRLMPPADIIALQEADRGTARAGGRHVARALAEELRMHYAYAPFATPPDTPPKPKQWYLDFEERSNLGDEGDTGIALLSRLPAEQVERLELPWQECAWRPRLALHASFRVGARRLHLFNAHIDPHTATAGRLAQHEAILERALRIDTDDAVVLLGDYNTLRAGSRQATRQLLEEHGYTTPLPTRTATWRAGLLRLHTDWIFVRNLSVTGWGVARTHGISDHWPVWVEIEVDRDAGS